METKQIKEKLEKRKKEIEKSLKKFASKDKDLKGDWDTVFPDFGENNLEEMADEVEEYENLLPVEHSLENKLSEINSALEKIKKNTYGICENCQKEISKERLKVFPEARFCLDCNK